jgi:hypothetical protein
MYRPVELLKSLFIVKRLFGIYSKPNESSIIDFILWSMNVALLLCIFVITFVFRNSFFNTSLGVTYAFDVILSTTPLATHIVILLESWRGRRIMKKLWFIIKTKNNYMLKYGHIRAKYDRKLFKSILQFIGIQIALCLCLDLTALYLASTSGVWFYAWMMLMWSFFVIRLYLCNLLILITLIEYRIGVVIDLIECIVEQARWKNVKKEVINQQLGEVKQLYLQIWQMNDCVNQHCGLILLIYSIYVFDYTMYVFYWDFVGIKNPQYMSVLLCEETYIGGKRFYF